MTNEEEIARINAQKNASTWREPKPVTVTVEGEDPRDVQYWVNLLQDTAKQWNWQTTRLHPSSFVIQPKTK